MQVLLDTNIYLKNPYYSGSEHEALKNYLSKANAKIVIPETVDQEVKKNLSAIAYKDARTLKKLSQTRLNLIKSFPTSEEIDEALINKYSQFISRRNIKLSNSSLSLSELSDRSVSEKPPFKPEGRGFRDALIWCSMLDYLKNNKGSQVAFISNNTSDFGRDGLKRELEEELNELGYSDRVFYFTDLDSFLGEYGVKIEFLNDDFIETVLGNEILTVAKRATLNELQVTYPDSEVDWELLEIEYQNYDIGNYYIYRADTKNYYLHVGTSLNFNVHFYGIKMTYAFNPNKSSWQWSPQELNASASGMSTLDFKIKVSKETEHKVEILSSEISAFPF